MGYIYGTLDQEPHILPLGRFLPTLTISTEVRLQIVKSYFLVKFSVSQNCAHILRRNFYSPTEQKLEILFLFNILKGIYFLPPTYSFALFR